MRRLVMTGLSLVAPLSIFTAEVPSSSGKVISYVGMVQFPGLKDKDPIPSIDAYYKGAHISCQEGAYILTDSKKHSEFSMIIALLEHPTANTIAHFEVPKGARYFHYHLKRIPVTSQYADTFEETWDIFKEEGRGPWQVPEEAQVIVMDPSCIEKITPLTWSKEGISLKLPTITFKKGIDKTKAYNKSLLASLDIKPFHKKDDVINNKQAPKSMSSFRKS